jgi:hypothetical protein
MNVFTNRKTGFVMDIVLIYMNHVMKNVLIHSTLLAVMENVINTGVYQSTNAAMNALLLTYRVMENVLIRQRLLTVMENAIPGGSRLPMNAKMNASL